MGCEANCEICPIDAAIAIIMWGYPKGMRGNSFTSLLQHIEQLKYKLAPHKEITHAQFLELLQLIPGIGLSTISKFLYFFSNKLEGIPCLILDQRIIKTIKASYFYELGGLQKIVAHNKTLYYLQYLKTIHKVSAEINCRPDQLEFFLFMFGQRLKVSDGYNYYVKIQQTINILNDFAMKLTKVLSELTASKSDKFFEVDELRLKINQKEDRNAEKIVELLLSIDKLKLTLIDAYHL